MSSRDDEVVVRRPASNAEVHDGAATYSRFVLHFYDLVVLALICRVVWRCDRRLMMHNYERTVGARHLDMGPGTGFFLDGCRFPVDRPDLTLVDLNPLVLNRAAHRIRRYRPRTAVRNVLEPLALGDRVFDSIGMNFLLHCVPGSIPEKAQIFDVAMEYLAPGGRVFGATVLAHGVRHTPRAERMLREMNRKKTFHNERDALHDLEAEIASRFDHHEVEVHGSVALFRACLGTAEAGQ